MGEEHKVCTSQAKKHEIKIVIRMKISPDELCLKQGISPEKICLKQGMIGFNQSNT